MSLSGSHVQWSPVHFGAGVSTDTGSQQDISGGVMTVLSSQVEGGRPQLQDRQAETKAERQTDTVFKVPVQQPDVFSALSLVLVWKTFIQTT